MTYANVSEIPERLLSITHNITPLFHSGDSWLACAAKLLMRTKLFQGHLKFWIGQNNRLTPKYSHLDLKEFVLYLNQNSVNAVNICQAWHKLKQPGWPVDWQLEEMCNTKALTHYPSDCGKNTQTVKQAKWIFFSGCWNREGENTFVLLPTETWVFKQPDGLCWYFLICPK